jgi:SAM-dependent methyltransferase
MDVIDLKEFYASPLGQVARRLIAHRIMARWKGLTGSTVLGLGYTLPYLDHWRASSERLLAFMPARQGVMHWPDDGPSQTALVDETELPLEDASVDLALVVHGLELTDYLPDMLGELWRVLSPQGRVLFVVPNRRGMWARFDNSPFGHGRPFSRQQLTRILRDAQFSPAAWAHGLFMPPINRRIVHRSATALERAGMWVSPGFSGIIVVEATKQVYAVPQSRRARQLVPDLKPQIMPSPAFEALERRG